MGEDPSINGTVFGVANVKVHPRYNPQSNVADEPDVAVLTLDQNANALVPDILPIEFNRHPLTGLDAEALVDELLKSADTVIRGLTNRSFFYQSAHHFDW